MLRVALVGLAGLTVRSVVTAAGTGGGDLATVYAAARVWADGGDPYDVDRVAAAFDAAGGPAAVRPHAYWTPPLYPPGTLAAVAPLARLRWPAARAAWAVGTGLLLAAMVAVLPAVAGLRWSDPRGVAVAVGALLLSPTRAAMALGQPAVATAALIVLAAWAAGRGHARRAGVALGVAACLKPQLAGPFIAYLVLRRHGRAATWAAVLFAAVTAASAAHLSHDGVRWWGEWAAAVRRASSPGQVNDVTPGGVNRFAMVNLAVVLHAFFRSPTVVTGIVAVVAIGTAAAFAVVVRRRPTHGLPPAELAFVAAWSLLPVYHRWYDAEPLALAVAWAAAAWPARSAVAVAVLLMPFMTSLVVRLPRAWPGPHAWAWDAVLMPDQSWAAVGLTAVLLRRCGR